jgi:hypothetical protein
MEGIQRRSKKKMKNRFMRKSKGLAVLLALCMVMPSVPGGIDLAANTIPNVYGAAYQNATSTANTTLPAAVDVNGVSTPVTWELEKFSFFIPYDTVAVTGKTDTGSTVNAQVEVIPAKENELVYFVDASRDTGKESKAYTSVQALASTTLINKDADQVFNATDNWGRVGSNFKEKGTSSVDVTKKIQTGWYSSEKTTDLTYQYYLEAGTYTLNAGFYEWWNNRSIKKPRLSIGSGCESNQSKYKGELFTMGNACVG